MSEHQNTTVQPPPKAPSRMVSRKARAILAGGLVLGVGAAITLAAWNDSEFAANMFGAGAFNLEGTASDDDLTFADHGSTGAAASLAFSAGFDNLAPEETVASAFRIRLDDTTTNAANVIVASGLASGTASADLTYGILQVPTSADCTETAAVGDGTTMAEVVAPATTFAAGTPTGNQFVLAEGTVADTAGQPAVLCIQVTGGAGLDESTTATGTWEFLAESIPD